MVTSSRGLLPYAEMAQIRETLIGIESIPLPFLAVDCHQIIREHNKRAKELFKARIDGKSISEIVPSFDLVQQVFRTLMTREQAASEFKYGSRTLNVILSPLIVDRQVERVCILFSDVSAVSNALDESNIFADLLETIVGRIPEGVLVVRKDRQVIYVNSAFQEIVGLSVQSVLGKNIDELYEQSAIVFPSVLEETFANQGIGQGLDRLGNGQDVEAMAVPCFDKQNRLERVILYMRAAKEKSETSLRKHEDRPIGKDASPFVTRNKKMLASLEILKRVAPVDVPVLLLGETGVGKGLFADQIHSLSGRSGRFVKINSSALPQELIESELFGHEKGAFTGAKNEGKPGLFEIAAGGTLFLDEIGDLPLSAQAKLLNVLDDRKIRRVGGVSDISINVRIIAATNADLNKKVDANEFRRDLYHRLNVVAVHLLPLRDRAEDIPVLIGFFLNKFNQKYCKSIRFSSAALACLVQHDWPGNVRELSNFLESVVVLSSNDYIDETDLPTEFVPNSRKTSLARASGRLKDDVQELEKNLLVKALADHKSSRQIAGVLGISHTAVLKKIKRYRLGDKVSV